MFRLITLLLAAVALSACTNPNDLEKNPVYLGDFTLGHNVAVAPNLTKGPASREATKEEWTAAMKEAIDERFSRYDGDKFYHLGISIEGYVLAIPGVPIVASPKSALILNVTAWDDATQTKLNDKPEQITVIESFSGPTLLGSGLTQSKEKQMYNLTRNASKLIQNWLVRENDKKGWFEPDGKPAAGKDKPVVQAKAKPKVLPAEPEADASAEVESTEPAETALPAEAAAPEGTTTIPGDIVLDDPEVAPLSGEES